MGSAVPLSIHPRWGRVGWPAAALVATLAIGLLIEDAAHSGDPAAAAGDLAVAAAFVACGTAVWTSVRGSDLIGPLMVATGAAWLVGSVADELALLHRGPLLQLLVAAPGGRPRGRMAWPAVAAGYALALVPEIARTDGATVALAASVAAVAIGGWARAGGVERRAQVVPAAAAAAIGAVLTLGAVGADGETVLWIYEAVLVVTAAAFFADLRWGSWAHAAVTALVIDLGDVRTGSLTAALGRAVGDPSLVVGYRLDNGSLADERGRPVTVPDPGAGRAVTSVNVDGVPAAVLVHDPTAFRDPALADGVAAGVRIALDNMRLEADIRARVDQVEASRARLLDARDAERRRLEARLNASVDRRLDEAGDVLRNLADAPDPMLSALPAELDRIRAELRRFASGLRPRELQTGGLAAALPELAVRAPLQVELSIECGRLEPPVEAAAWFVCSEGLANIAKHAGADRAEISIRREDRCLVVTVDDDGRGGADPSAGRGLGGLTARVQAIGGRVEVGEGPAGGTRLRATLPLEGSS